MFRLILLTVACLNASSLIEILRPQSFSRTIHDSNTLTFEVKLNDNILSLPYLVCITIQPDIIDFNTCLHSTTLITGGLNSGTYDIYSQLLLLNDKNEYFVNDRDYVTIDIIHDNDKSKNISHFLSSYDKHFNLYVRPTYDQTDHCIVTPLIPALPTTSTPTQTPFDPQQPVEISAAADTLLLINRSNYSPITLFFKDLHWHSANERFLNWACILDNITAVFTGDNGIDSQLYMKLIKCSVNVIYLPCLSLEHAERCINQLSSPNSTTSTHPCHTCLNTYSDYLYTYNITYLLYPNTMGDPQTDLMLFMTRTVLYLDRSVLPHRTRIRLVIDLPNQEIPHYWHDYIDMILVIRCYQCVYMSICYYTRQYTLY